MGYTINSAKDSRGDEDQFVARFNQNLPAIQAYKQQNGGAWEDAYQAVMKQPWPEGRSVKLNNGQAEMTKDRTVKSVLGKYVALPAGIAAGGYLAAPAIAGALGAGGAAAGGGVVGGGLGTGALAAGATIPGAGMVSGVGGASLLGGGAGSVLAGLGKTAMSKAASGGVSDAMSAASQSMASNRGAKTAGMLDEQDAFETQMLNREREKRRAQAGAYRSSMVGNLNESFTPSVRPAGVPGSYAPPNDESRLAGGEIYGQGMRRLLQPDLVNQQAPPPLNRLNLPLDPSKGESALGWGSMLAGLLKR